MKLKRKEKDPNYEDPLDMIEKEFTEYLINGVSIKFDKNPLYRDMPF